MMGIGITHIAASRFCFHRSLLFLPIGFGWLDGWLAGAALENITIIIIGSSHNGSDSHRILWRMDSGEDSTHIGRMEEGNHL